MGVLHNFRQGSRCAECKGNKRKTIEHVRRVFQIEGYILLSSKYKNSHSPLEYRCPNGHINKTTWTEFDQGRRCPDCGRAKREIRLGEILEDVYGDGAVRSQDNLGFLGAQTVDYSVRELRMAFEHDGEQHFRPTRFKGITSKQAQENFVLQQLRDTRKNRLCQENNYVLIRIAYHEDLTMESVQSKIDEVLEKRVIHA
jgi:hypothetical protein